MAGNVATSRGGGDAQKNVGRVVHYMAERTEPSTSPTAVGVEQLHADYQVWCVRKMLWPLLQSQFVDEFEALRYFMWVA
jgi:hypothetical protein